MKKWGPLLKQVTWLDRASEHIPHPYTLGLAKVFEFLLQAEPEDVGRGELWPLSLTILADRLRIRKADMRERLLTLEDLRLIVANPGRPDNPKTGERGRPYQFSVIATPGMVLETFQSEDPDSEFWTFWKALHPTDKRQPARFVIPSLVVRIVSLLRDKQVKNKETALPARRVARLLGVTVKQTGDALAALSSENWQGLGLVFAGLQSGRSDRRGGPRSYLLWLEKPK